MWPSIIQIQTLSSGLTIFRGALPYPGTWYYPNSGVSQLVYPDFQPADVTDQIYYPSYQIANLYAAYSTGSGELAFTTSTEPDPVTNDLAYVDLQNTGLTDVLKGVYGSITYGLSASDQTTLAQASATANDALNSVNSAVKAAYQANSVFNTSYPTATGSASNLTSSLQAIANVITSHPELILPGTGIYQSYQNSKDNLPLFTSTLVGELVSGSINWAETFTQSFGTQNPITGAYEYTIPWDPTLYTQYQNAISSSSYTTWKNLSSLQQSQSSGIQSNAQYLIDLENYNRTPNGFFTTPTSAYFSVVEGVAGADTYAPLYTVTPLNTASTGTEIDFSLFTDSYSSTTASSSTGDSLSWDASAGAGGWWWGASASTNGSSVNQTSWSEFDSTATNMTGNFVWDDINQRTITPSTSWFNVNALNQAWSAGMAANNPNFKGGFAFSTPDLANQYIQASLYYPSSIAYGNPSQTLKTTTKDISSYSDSSFSSFQTKTSAQGGFGWGPFSVGASSSYSTSTQDTDSQYEWNASGNTATITNNPLEGVTGSPSTGDPAAIMGFQLTRIGEVQAVMVDPTNSSDSSSSTSSRMSNDRHFTETLPRKVHKSMNKSLITFSNPESNSTLKRQYQLGKGNDTHYGRDKRDFVIGDSGGDVLAGLGGNDSLYGGRGDDVIYGGDGINKIWGGPGEDYVVFERNHSTNGAFNKVKDWSMKDKLSFDGYIPEDVNVKGSSLFLDGNRVGFFRGMNESELEILVAAAHYSFT